MSHAAQKTRWIRVTLNYEHVLEVPVEEDDTFEAIEARWWKQAETVYGLKDLKDWTWEAIADSQ